jgi:hypothetical protein
LTDNNPDFIFFSVFGYQHFKFRCKKIFYTGENIRPDFTVCDYAFSFDLDDNQGRNYRLPLYVQYDDVTKLTLPKHPDELLKKKTDFCNFVYSNPDCKRRIKFFRKLSKYKKVDSGGRILNNIGYFVPNKIEFLSKYKFTIAFENGEYPGYTTEKLFEPMLAGSVPIYWGNPQVRKDFNTKSFINSYDFKNDDELIDRIIEIDQDDELYLQILNEPYFINNTVNQYVDEKNILKKFEEIFNSLTEPIYVNSPAYSESTFTRKVFLIKKRIKNYTFYLKRIFF